MVANEINFALVEETRPPLYTAMKYWGKKPHNIWREYIETYTPEEGLYLDPFAGSAISAFEAVKAGRKAICFDLNPLTSFFIEVLASEFEPSKFSPKVIEILEAVREDPLYKKLFSVTCPVCGETATGQSFKWEGGRIYEIGVECGHCSPRNGRHLGRRQRWNGTFVRYLKQPSEDEERLAAATVNIPFWVPDVRFPNSPSFSAALVAGIGGNTFSDLWTRRNLFVIAKIFDLIKAVEDKQLQYQLLSGFTQTIHLCTKMSVPRRGAANRPFSTSWGRSAYLAADRQMEMNPLLVFEGSCFGRQSVSSALTDNAGYLGKYPKLLRVDNSNKSNRSKNFDIKYGTVDINNLGDYVDEGTIDFIMTDPPYGGLVQYLDLSSIWLVWLEQIDERFSPNYEAEITVKDGVQSTDSYERKFLNGVRQLHKVLKEDGKIVFTFHNKDLSVWNMFLKSLSVAGFKVEKVIHQQNRRTGEANVANPYGTSASDLYIRCVKSTFTDLKSDLAEFEQFMVAKTIELIALRNEPTPYQILFNGLMTELSSAGFDLQDFDTNVEKLLSKYVGEIFTITDNPEVDGGKYWWFVDPEAHIRYPDKKLSERVEESIVSLLRRKTSVAFDEVLGDIFVRYPNGLTPDQRSITSILSTHAYRSGGRWVYRGDSLLDNDYSEHTRILFQLNSIGKKLGYETFIGKREQAEQYQDERLGSLANPTILTRLSYGPEQIRRIEMIDMLWIEGNEVQFAIEVENSTNFTSGIQRGSNLNTATNKIMVLPNERKNEFQRIVDPLFIENFRKYKWRYMFYDDVDRLFSQRKPTAASLDAHLREL